MKDELEQLKIELEREKRANKRLEKKLSEAFDDIKYLKNKLLLFSVLNIKKDRR